MYGIPIANGPIEFLFDAAERFQMSDLKMYVTRMARDRISKENVI